MHHRTRITPSRLALLAAATSLVACGGGSGDDAAGPTAPEAGTVVDIRVLSNRADLVSGGDALVELAVPAGADSMEWLAYPELGFLGGHLLLAGLYARGRVIAEYDLDGALLRQRLDRPHPDPEEPTDPGFVSPRGTDVSPAAALAIGGDFYGVVDLGGGPVDSAGPAFVGFLEVQPWEDAPGVE